MCHCICPTVQIRCLSGHVSEHKVKEIADVLNAEVLLIETDTPAGERGLGIVQFGKHRKDCPCYGGNKE